MAGLTSFYGWIISNIGLPWWVSDKESACLCRRCGFDTWVGKVPWRRKWQPTLVFLPGKSQWQRSLANYNPRSHERVRHDLATKQQKQYPLYTHTHTHTHTHTQSCFLYPLKSLFFKTIEMTSNQCCIINTHLHTHTHIHYCAKKYSESESRSVVSDSLRPHGLYSPWNSPGQSTGVGSRSLLQGIKSRSPTLQADSLPSEPPGEHYNFL